MISKKLAWIGSLELLLCTATKGEGGHISFSADPGRRRRRDSLVSPYLLNQWVEFYQTCMDISLGQAKELIKFW